MRIFTLSAFVTVILSVFTASAQVVCTPNPPTGEAGITPNWQALQCIQQNVYYERVIHIENFDSLIGEKVNFIRLDSLTNLPTNINWQADANPAQYGTGATGCVKISGTTNDPLNDSVQLGIWVTIELEQTGQISGEAGALSQQYGQGDGFNFYLRIIAPGGTCDTTSAIRELPAFSAVKMFPNPFTSTAQLSFNATEKGNYTVAMYNVLGKAVYEERQTVVPGKNQFTINRKGLQAGVYFFTLSNGKKTFTQRVVVAD